MVDDTLTAPLQIAGERAVAAGEAFEQAMASVAATASTHEDEFGICPCHPLPAGHPQQGCFWCAGTGYRLTRRTLRPPAPTAQTEQALRAELKTERAEHARYRQAASKTVIRAATLLEQAGKVNEAIQTRQAAKAMLQDGQDE